MASLRWKCRDREWTCAPPGLVMGILNVTPDSFSDGGHYPATHAAVARGLSLAEQGADWIDIGGESSRPGAQPVAEEEELRRVVPVVEALATRTPAGLSVDTTKAAVARAVLAAGAHAINDISAGRFDPGLLPAVAEAGAGLVLMHMQGTPATMQADPRYGDVVEEVLAFLRERTDAAQAAGVARDGIVWDPGIGFGKTLDHNLDLLRGLPRLCAEGFPVLVGLSRKRFLGQLTGLPVEDRLAPGLAALLHAAAAGARLFRVHDVKESCAALRVAGSLGALRA